MKSGRISPISPLSLPVFKDWMRERESDSKIACAFSALCKKPPTVSNLAVRTSFPHCLLKTLHLVTLAHSSHLLLARIRLH